MRLRWFSLVMVAALAACRRDPTPITDIPCPPDTVVVHDTVVLVDTVQANVPALLQSVAKRVTKRATPASDAQTAIAAIDAAASDTVGAPDLPSIGDLMRGIMVATVLKADSSAHPLPKQRLGYVETLVDPRDRTVVMRTGTQRYIKLGTSVVVEFERTVGLGQDKTRGYLGLRKEF